MNTRTILTVSLAAVLAACSGATSTSPTESGTKPPDPQRISYSVEALLSPDQVGNTGIQSPAAIVLTFRGGEGQLLDILRATATLKDEAGAVLATQTFGPVSGTLAFSPMWAGGAKGRKVEVTGVARIGGIATNIEFTHAF